MKDLDNVFFVHGYGGTGKTFLWNAIMSRLRSEKLIVLAVASSGVASLLLPGGRTAHSRFKIPIVIDESSVCDIRRGSFPGDLIVQCSLIIWDEAPMTHRHCFESLDRSMRDILGKVDSSCFDKVFGSKTVLLGGDFRQVLPMVEGGGRSETLDASITNSYLWKHVTILRLTINMRLFAMADSGVSTEQVKEFNDWVLSIGDGTAKGVPCDDGDSDLIEIPHDILIPRSESAIDDIIRCTYPNLEESYCDPIYLGERAIIAPKNDTTDEINSRVLSLIPGHEKVYLSSDSLVESSKEHGNLDLLYLVEFLNSLQFKGIPPHKLVLKIGSPVMLLRNLNQSAGLWNGTRLIVTQLDDRVLEAQIISGSHIGDKVLLPRIALHVSSTRWPFVLSRRQYPVRLCYAMTINKSQGQTFHGQLYVAVSRVTSRTGLRILVDDDMDSCHSATLNIVYREMGYSLLSDLNSTRYNWCINVRVVRMWHVSGVSRGKNFASTELVLADEENRSTGRRNHRLHWAEKYGQIFRLHNRGPFSASRKEGSKLYPVPTIFFTSWTTIEEIAAEESANLPLYIFNFVDFEDLDSRARNADGLVDIIGQLTVMHPVVHSSSLNGPSVRRELELRDLSGRSLSVTLWGEHATSFEDEFLIQTIGSDEPVVIIFTRMQVRLFLGTPSCRSNAATKWYINIDIAEVNAFRASLQGRGSEVQILPGDADAEAGGVDEENANRKTVSELLSLNPHDNNDVRFTCHATIREIDVTNGWWYKGCSNCKKGLKATLQGGFELVFHVYNYKLNVAIEDATGRAKIFMFGGVAEQVVRRTASDLVEESSSNQILLPAALRALVGRSYVFQAVISEQTFRTGVLCFQAEGYSCLQGWNRVVVQTFIYKIILKRVLLPWLALDRRALLLIKNLQMVLPL
ncbi:hypothetical protein U9M48_030532 [Paspalum notatum var. saurae]|uniref:ATP-dependent DNA helicase n=1 Tax=Paspalum notatum var. saurae TaxID=547442 RepID=A0AAQ3U1K8_PASNO